MKLTGQEREAARLMYHLMGHGSYQCAKIFGVLPSSMYRILKNKPMPTYKNFDKGQCRKDREEILAYIAQNGPCTRFDLELCLHQGNSAVLGHLASLLRTGSIERYHDSYRVPA